MSRRLGLLAAAAVSMTLAACGQQQDRAGNAPAAESGVLNLYTARHYDADQKLYDLFQEQTGIEVKRIEGRPDELIARMKAEGANSPADVFVAADAGALWRAQDAGLLQASSSETLNQAIPANLREPDGHFYGFSRRARVVAYDPAKVQPAEIDDYAKLATPRFKGKICARSGDNVYNLSLVGALIEAWGEERAKAWVEGVAANLARPPEGGDRDQIRAVAAGVCEVALTNSYYFIRMANGEDANDRQIATKLKLGFPSLDGQGPHVNISGGGLAANAPNKANGIRFLEFLASPEAQAIVTESNYEYPAVEGAAPAASVAPYADFTAHPMNVSRYGVHQAKAQSMISAAGWR
ncbi:extracellular solute-binding protein [Brevundimonas vesicularis]|uniref:extracellular solute-binding protein n=1 Tax=Brevundimonas vesicularis TaxID=41276 RepID=UPI0038D47010